jgi:uncharacterized protein (DUF1015 family)
MVEIRPFRGLRYDARKVGEIAAVMAPPYDVIDDAGRAELAARSPHAAIHFILPVGEGDAKYPAGAAAFRRQVEAAMLRDPRPAFYVYHQRFEQGGREHTRKGFIGLVRLTRFGEGPVLAHERTLAGPKRDRLELMRACEAHLELVFGMFSDPERRWEAAVDPHRGAPVLEARFDGIDHALWRVDDPQGTAALERVLADLRVYIADGHHRYETMCTYRDELRAEGNPAAEYGMIFLSNLDDPGLVVLPTHRLVHSLSRVDLPELLTTLAPWFHVEHLELPRDAQALSRALAPEAGRATFGLTVPGSKTLAVVRLRADFDPEAAGLGRLAPPLRHLDVVLLHELVLERALGISKAAQEAKTNLGYLKSTADTLEVAAVGDGSTQLVAFMNATPVSDVVAVCDGGEVMPQKSTFFYPKIPGGLVFHDLRRASAEDEA